MSEIDYNTRDLQISLMRLQEENTKLKEQSLLWMKQAEKISIQSRKFEYELTHLKSRVWELHSAIENAGINPRFHHKIMKKHRKEWPTLWKVIDRLVTQYDKNL